jgi:hypothetical protein
MVGANRQRPSCLLTPGSDGLIGLSCVVNFVCTAMDPLLRLISAAYLYLPSTFADYPTQDAFPSGRLPMIAVRRGVDQGIKPAGSA